MLVRSSTRISLGAAYYAEYQAAERLDVDLDLMASAGLNVVRVGESVWSKWEPEDGVFSLDWMTRILDGALARGIGVILGTPTYAIPPWLARKHPELAIRRRDGRRIGWGARQEANFTDPLFRSYAERIIRAILAKFSHHPAVVGYQVDNEPGLEVIYNENVFEDFKASLRSQFESVDALNAAWGLTYWSHELSDWDDLWPPEGNSSPQYDLSWREFQARITHEFIDWEASIVREYCAPEQFVTTCLAYSRPSLNDFEINSTLDVASGNAYFGMQDHLDFESDLAPIEPWASTGPWGLELQADRMYSSKQARFLVTETNAATVGSAHRNFPPYDGQLEQAGVLLLARGARMIEYWHWHSLPFGAETYWGGVLPHNGVPGRIYKEVKAFGDKLAAFGDLFDGFRPDADIGVIYSNASKWALEFQPPIALADGTADRNSYNRIFQAFYRGFSQHGVQARLVHAEQLEALSPSELVDRHPVLLAPALYVISDKLLGLLRSYTLAGGHLVVTPKTGVADTMARVRSDFAPPTLHEIAGVHYTEFSTLEFPARVKGSSKLRMSSGAAASEWADLLELDTADAVASFAEGPFEGRPLITTQRAAAGRLTYIATVPNDVLARDIARFIAPHPICDAWNLGGSKHIQVRSGLLIDGRRVWFIFNWSNSPAELTTPISAVDPLTLAAVSVGSAIRLAPWGTHVLAEELL